MPESVPQAFNWADVVKFIVEHSNSHSEIVQSLATKVLENLIKDLYSFDAVTARHFVNESTEMKEFINGVRESRINQNPPPQGSLEDITKVLQLLFIIARLCTEELRQNSEVQAMLATLMKLLSSSTLAL